MQRVKTSLLAEYDEGEAGFLAREVLKRASNMEGTALMLANREEVPNHIETQADELRDRLEKGEPWQYITGEALFHGHTFSVGPGVLIPRPETEMLVEEALKFGDSLGRSVRVLDACTGSGCIAHSIALARPDWQVSGFDISPQALAYAHKNKELLGSNATIFQADLLGDFAAICPPNSLDILVSNPPYVPAEEAGSLAKHVRDFEPHLALFAPEGDDFLFFEALESFGSYCLNKAGLILVEFHAQLAINTMLIFQKEWNDPNIIKDSFNLPRLLKVKKNKKFNYFE